MGRLNGVLASVDTQVDGYMKEFTEDNNTNLSMTTVLI
jgi:hypothetical protein